MIDGLQASQVEVGWWEAFFNIKFYIQSWVRPGCGYPVPDPSMREQSIALKQRALQMIYLCSSAELCFLEVGIDCKDFVYVYVCVHVCRDGYVRV